MPNKELNFSSEDFYLIGGTESTTTFGSPGDYIRLTIRNEAGNVNTLGDGSKAIFYATPNTESLTLYTPGQVDGNVQITIPTNDFTIYQDTNSTSLNYYIKPNEILSSSLIPEGNYTLQTDFLSQFQPEYGSGMGEVADEIYNKTNITIKKRSSIKTFK